MLNLRKHLVSISIISIFIMLIMDIEAMDLDFPVILVHYSNFVVAFLDTINSSSLFFDAIVILKIVRGLCIYFSNFNFTLLFIAVIKEVLHKLLYEFILLKISLRNFYNNQFLLTFHKIQHTNSKAFLSIP